MKWQKDAYKKTKNNFSKREGIQMIGRNKKAGILRQYEMNYMECKLFR